VSGAGIILANGASALTIDTGVHVIDNATRSSHRKWRMVINSDVLKAKLLWANGGDLSVSGAEISDAATLRLFDLLWRCRPDRRSGRRPAHYYYVRVYKSRAFFPRWQPASEPGLWTMQEIVELMSN
jgi:hypothetical protein